MLFKIVFSFSLLTISLLQAEFIRNDNLNIVWDTDNNLLWQDESYENIVFDGERYWNSTPNDKLQNWQGAIDYCENLNFAGVSDWVLPNIEILKTLITDTKHNYGNYSFNIDSSFKYMPIYDGWGYGEYWSSTPKSLSTTHALNVLFYDGYDSGNGKDICFYVRCVREINSNDFNTLTFSSLTTLDTNDTINETSLNTKPTLTLKTTSEKVKIDEEVTIFSLASDDGKLSYKWEVDNQIFDTEDLKYSFSKKGSYKVKLTVTDEYGESAYDSVIIEVLNTKPIAKDLTLNIDGYEKIILSASDSDGDTLSYEIVQQPINGKIDEIIGDKIFYEPNEYFNGVDNFSYKAYDGEDYSNIATVILNISQNESIIEPTPEITPTPTDEINESKSNNCEIPKGSAKIVDLNGCELKEEYKLGESIDFNFIYKNPLGKVFEGDIYSKCKIKNSEAVLLDRVNAKLIFQNNGLAQLTCVYDDIIATHQFKVGNFEGGKNSAIIVVGKGSDNDELREAFEYLGSRVYNFLHSQGYSKDDIDYFNSFGEQKLVDDNLDGKKDNVVDESDFTQSDLEEAILNMPISDNPLLIYLIDHGTKGGILLINKDEKIVATKLKDTLDKFQMQTKRKVIVVVDSCYSGAFVEVLKGDDRVIISSGTADQTIPMSKSGISFTNYFIKNLQDKKSIKDSFNLAYNSYRKIAKNTYPQADFTDEESANKPFGFLFNASVNVIKTFTGQNALKIPKTTPSLRQTFSLKADNLIGIENSQAFVTITPPQTVVITPNNENVIEIQSEKVPLKYNSLTDEFNAEYELTTNGYYEVVYEITDETKEKVLSDSVTIQVGDSTSGVEFVSDSKKSLNVKTGWNLLSLPTDKSVLTSKFEN